MPCNHCSHRIPVCRAIDPGIARHAGQRGFRRNRRSPPSWDWCWCCSSSRVVILKQGFDTDTPAGKLALIMFAAFAEFENGIRKERQIEGIARARTEGKYQGRKPKLSAEQQTELQRRYAANENRRELARQFGIDRTTVHRYCNAS